MVAPTLRVGVFGDMIVVTDRATKYYAVYARPTQRVTALAAHGLVQYLTLLRRRPTNDRALIERAHNAALKKARALGWPV